MIRKTFDHIHSFHPQKMQAASYSGEQLAGLSSQLLEMVDPASGVLRIEMPEVCDCGLLRSTFESVARIRNP
jgi:hypothetical protein